MESARRNGVEILPVDSEHCAIFQCLKAGRPEEIRQILLTASGGPFYGRSAEELAKIRVEDALAHPTWRMGPKITVDSATLLNKGFEIIEAVHLFGVRPEQVRVLVHRQSIVHSMVEFNDHSVIAQLAVPDMRMCVQYAVEYPCRMPGVAEPLDLTKVAGLTFADPDEVTFPLLRCAKEAIGRGGALPAVLNAANEEAVAAFLAHRIGFTDIFEVVLETVSDLSAASASTALEERYAWDETARACAGQKIAARSASFGKGGLV
jgi:1-deoxy-D-xylulose-5-phosphate reductoisomerase